MTTNHSICADLFEHIVKDIKGNAMTTSLDVARVFGKQHKNVLQAIENLDCSDDFNELNFQLVMLTSENATMLKLNLPYGKRRDELTFSAMYFKVRNGLINKQGTSTATK